MTDTTDDNERLHLLLDALPEEMSGEDIITFVCSIVATYAEDAMDAAHMVNGIVDSLRDYYTDGECMCDECVARRRKEAN